jgi:hypothetical protein
MNNTFSLPRFSLLLKKTLLERPMQLLGLTVLSFSLVFLCYVICKLLDGFETAQNASFLLGLIGGGCFLASFVFNYFSSNAMGSSYLTLPASQFEKWLCAVLITGVLYVVLFLLFFRFVDVLFVGMYHRSLDPNKPFYKELYEQVQLFPYNGFVAVRSSSLFTNFTGAMLVGSLYFNKVSFIKVALVVCGIWFGIFMLNFIVAKAMINNVQSAVPYVLVWIKVDENAGNIQLPEKIMNIVKIFDQYLIPGALWLLAYLRLKEKEF